MRVEIFEDLLWETCGRESSGGEHYLYSEDNPIKAEAIRELVELGRAKMVEVLDTRNVVARFEARRPYVKPAIDRGRFPLGRLRGGSRIVIDPEMSEYGC